MKRYTLLLACSLLFKIGNAQNFDNAMPFLKSIDAKDLYKHLSILASDEYEGRETGKEGQRKASAYIQNEFQKLGLVPPSPAGYKQDIALVQKVLASRKLIVNQHEMTIGDEFSVAKDRLSIEALSNELIFVGYGINEGEYNSFKNIDVTNKVVVVLSGEPNAGGKYLLSADGTKTKWSDRKVKIEEIRKLNPALIIYIDNDYDKYKTFYKHQLESNSLALSYKLKIATNVPVISVGKNVANELFAPNKKSYDKIIESYSTSKKAKKALILKSSINVNISFIEQQVNSDNVLGMIPGSSITDEYLFVTAHYDHIGVTDGKVFNGADDDGSGTVSLIEIAQAFMDAKKAGYAPKRNIIFMAVSGEEKGLLGSLYYTDHPVVPLEKTVADLNIDMVGRIDEAHSNDTNYVYIIGSDKLSSELHEINVRAGEEADISLDYKYNDPNDPNMFYYRSDHYNFAKNNIPIIFYFNGVHADYHKEGDEVSKITFPMLAKRAQLVFLTAWEVANRDKRLVVDKNNDFPERNREK